MFAYIAPTSILSIPLTVSNDIGAEKYLLSPALVFRPSSSLKHQQPETEDGKGETNGNKINNTCVSFCRMNFRGWLLNCENSNSTIQ